MKYPVLRGSILVDAMRGIYLVTTWWHDGSMTEERIPCGPIILPGQLWI